MNPLNCATTDSSVEYTTVRCANCRWYGFGTEAPENFLFRHVCPECGWGAEEVFYETPPTP